MSDKTGDALPLYMQLRRARDRAGVTALELAWNMRNRTEGEREAGYVAPSSIAKIENGQSEPRRATVELICEALDIDPNDLPGYRLMLLREGLDERVVGAEKAYANLNAVESALATTGDAALQDALADSAEALASEPAQHQRGGSRRRTKTPQRTHSAT